MDTDRCLEIYSTPIMIQDASQIGTIVVGLAIVGAALVALLRKHELKRFTVAAVIGLGCLTIALTGTVITLSGKALAPELNYVEAGASIRDKCVSLNTAEPSDVPNTAPVIEQTRTTENDIESAKRTLAEIGGESGLVWIFYSTSRGKADAMILEKVLRESGHSAFVDVSNFGNVEEPQNEGVTRILISQESLIGAANALSIIVSQMNLGKPLVQGPFDLARGPIQIQMY